MVFYIIFTIVLILLGKFIGKIAYGWHWSVDPGSYKSQDDTKHMTPEDVSAVELELAQDEGRFVGARIGFITGSALSIFKAYDIYSKMRTAG